MKKISLFSLSMALMLIFVLSSNALAEIISVGDMNTNDLNIITSQGRIYPSSYFVIEDYNETHLIPYPSHDGWAIVNSEGEFFVKMVEVTPYPPTQDILNFEVVNTTPYVWSDYHLVFSPNDNVNILSYGNTIFQSSKLENNELSFWGDDPSHWVYPGNSLGFGLELDAPQDFTITQIATTNAVPIPGAVWLLGSGLLGLLRFRKEIGA